MPSSCYDYARCGNPTIMSLQRNLAAMEGAKYAFALNCGMSATISICSLLKQGDHLLCIDDVYGGTQRYLRKVFTPQTEISWDMIDFSDLNKVKAAIKKNTKIAESDVTRASVAQMDIQNVMVHIETYEQAIETGDLDINTIQTLSSVLYPKAIEYFSAFDNNMYNDLLNRMQSLLQREDILMVINSAQEEKQAVKEAGAAADKGTSLLPSGAAAESKPAFDFNVSAADVERLKREEEKEQEEEEKSAEQPLPAEVITPQEPSSDKTPEQPQPTSAEAPAAASPEAAHVEPTSSPDKDEDKEEEEPTASCVIEQDDSESDD